MLGRGVVVRALTLVVVAAAIWTAAQAPAAVPADPLQPGDLLDAPLGECTLGFVLSGADGGTYFLTAGHCVEPGQIVSSPGFRRFGVVALDDDGPRDVALIRVRAGHEEVVSARVAGHPAAPSGETRPRATAAGDRVAFSGHGVGFETAEATRSGRVGVLVSDSTSGYCVDGPVAWGDSGGPVIHVPSGGALGIVSRLGTDCPATLAGATVQGARDRASELGVDVSLRTP